MNDEHETLEEFEAEEPSPDVEETGEQFKPIPDDFNIDEALAAVSRLDEIAASVRGEEVVDAIETIDTDEEEVLDVDIAEDEDSIVVPEGEDEGESYEAEVDSDQTTYIETEFEHPPLMTLQRGQSASVIPALVLMAIGAWLTISLTTGTLALDATLLIPLIGIILGVVFLSQWIQSRRWSQGSFFTGMMLLLNSGVLFFLLQPNDYSLVNGWTLFILATGLAVILTGMLTQPAIPRLSIIGFLLVLAGLVGFFATSGFLASAISDFLAQIWFIPIGLAILFLILPIFRRARN